MKESAEQIKSSLEVYFENFLRQEDRVASMSDQYKLPRIVTGSTEYLALKSVGISDEVILSCKITRGNLLSAGFSFVNRYANWENPIFNVIIDGVNYGQRVLLTSDELATIYDYQRANPDDYGSSEISSNEFRYGYFSALLGNQDIVPPHMQIHINFLRICIFESFNNSKIKQKIMKHWREIYFRVNTGENPAVAERQFVEEELKNEIWWRDTSSDNKSFFTFNCRKTKAAGNFPTRVNSLSGLFSPFLTCGMMFSNNFDLLVLKHDSTMFRINLFALHLLKYGFSEIGIGRDNNGGQNYEIGNYIGELYPDFTDLQDEKGRFEKILEFDIERTKLDVAEKIFPKALHYLQQLSDGTSRKLLLEYRFEILKASLLSTLVKKLQNIGLFKQ